MATLEQIINEARALSPVEKVKLRQELDRELVPEGAAQSRATETAWVDHSLEEQRFVIMGLSEGSKILVVAHTDDGEIVRIISAREARHGERKSYEEG